MLTNSILRQHVVEFIRGTGVVTDGVTDATSTSGPWSWTVPNGVARITLDGTSAGGGGGGGNGALSPGRGGGGGGSTGAALQGAEISVIQGSTLTVTLGSGGSAGATGAGGGTGGSLTVAGMVSSFFSPYALTPRFVLAGGTGGGGGTAAGGSGGTLGNGTVANGGANASSPTGGTTAGILTAVPYGIWGGWLVGVNGSGGGGSSTVGATSGATGGYNIRGQGGGLWNLFTGSDTTLGTGSTDGTLSYGGGGWGGFSPFGSPLRAGNGNAAPTGTAYGYGFGGSGGGGNAAGSAGGDAYCRFTYWSSDI